MKKLLYSLIIVIAAGCSSFSQPSGYSPVGSLWSTNILLTDSLGTNHIYPRLHSMQSSAGNGPSFLLLNGANSGLFCFKPGVFQFSDGVGGSGANVHMLGDLTVDGTITGSAIVYSLTNITYATNAFNATNDQYGNLLASTNMLAAALLYPTNSAATNTDMRVTYGDVNWVTGFYWPNLDSTSFATTNYQTAVRILHGNGTGTNFGWPAQVHIYGSPYITNETVCTFFYNPNPATGNPATAGRTNLIVLPLW